MAIRDCTSAGVSDTGVSVSVVAPTFQYDEEVAEGIIDDPEVEDPGTVPGVKMGAGNC